MLSSVWKFNFEVMTGTATRFLSLLLSCVALGSDTQGTYKEQNPLFVRHARGGKLESDVQKNRSIKPKIRWKAKKSPDVWQDPHRGLEVQQALILISDLRQTAGPLGPAVFLLPYFPPSPAPQGRCARSAGAKAGQCTESPFSGGNLPRRRGSVDTNGSSRPPRASPGRPPRGY